MPQTGSLVVRAFTSLAQLPVSGATVIISSQEEDGRRKVYSIQTTDESGGTQPIQLEAPDQSLSESPGGAALSPITPWWWSIRNITWPRLKSSRCFRG